MEVDDLPPIDHNTDYEKILPIHQKRIIAFINHFITNTVSFLNTFAQSCESRLMAFEYKIQKVEASLLILESQLSSIASLDKIKSVEEIVVSKSVAEQSSPPNLVDLPEISNNDEQNIVVQVVNAENPSTAPKANQDPRFIRFFKMIQFGVPLAAVKHKMVVEGLDPNILEMLNSYCTLNHFSKPNAVIPGYDVEVKHNMSSTSSNSS